MPGTAECLCHKGLLFRAQDTLNNNSLGKKHSWQDRVSRSSSPLKTGKWGPFPCLNPSCGQQWPWSLMQARGEAPLCFGVCVQGLGEGAAFSPALPALQGSRRLRMSISA